MIPLKKNTGCLNAQIMQRCWWCAVPFQMTDRRIGSFVSLHDQGQNLLLVFFLWILFFHLVNILLSKMSWCLIAATLVSKGPLLYVVKKHLLYHYARSIGLCCLIPWLLIIFDSLSLASLVNYRTAWQVLESSTIRWTFTWNSQLKWCSQSVVIKKSTCRRQIVVNLQEYKPDGGFRICMSEISERWVSQDK